MVFFNINALPIFALSILRSISINNEQKIKFRDSFLHDYLLSNKSYDDYVVLFVDNIYQGVFKPMETDIFEGIKKRFYISNITLLEELVQFDSRPYVILCEKSCENIPISILEIQYSINIPYEDNLVEISNTLGVFDSGCSITNLNCNKWNPKTNKFSSTDIRDFKFYQYLNEMIKYIDEIPVKSSLLNGRKTIITFKLDLFIGVEDLRIPLKTFTINKSESWSLFSYESSTLDPSATFLLGMDVISQCNSIIIPSYNSLKDPLSKTHSILDFTYTPLDKKHIKLIFLVKIFYVLKNHLQPIFHYK